MLCDLNSSVSLEEIIPRTRARFVINDETECWIWNNRNADSGYGPYKWIYERYVQKPPTGMQIHHVCGNGAGGCVNPNHMELLPETQHHQMHAREHFAVIDVDQAREIRGLLTDLSLTTGEIAERYGVHRNIVERIGMGRIWSDVSDGQPIIYSHVCGYCHLPFSTTSRRKRYCSKSHQVAYSNLDPREKPKPPHRRIKRTYAGKIIGATI